MKHKDLAIQVLTAWHELLIAMAPSTPGFNITTFQHVIRNKNYEVCGSTCCACGKLALSPEFNALGFNMDPDRSVPTYKHHSGPDAVEAFFNITTTKYRDLFLSDGYSEVEEEEITLPMIIANIEKQLSEQ